MKYFYLFLIMYIFSCPSFAFENIVIPEANANYEQQSVISNEEFETLEKLILKKTYKSDSSSNRLSRLEKEIFGMEQKGDEEERYENLLTASEYYKDGYRANENNIQKAQEPQYYTYNYSPKDYIQTYETQKEEQPETRYYSYNNSGERYYPQNNTSNKKPSKIKQFLNDVIETFSTGVVTGYTPPLYYNNFDPLMGTSIIGYPQFPAYARTPYGYSTGYYPYRNRNYGYSRIHPSRNYNYPRNNYYHNPYGNGIRTYNSGASVKIID